MAMLLAFFGWSDHAVYVDEPLVKLL